MNDACSETRNATASAISTGLPIRPIGACAASRVWVALVEHRGLDRAGEHRVDPDARTGPVRRPRSGSGRAAPTSTTRRRVVGERPDRAGAAGVDDRRAVGLAQVRQGRLDAQERAETVDPPAALETLPASRRPARPGAARRRCSPACSAHRSVRLSRATARRHCSAEVTSSSTASTRSSSSSATLLRRSSASRSHGGDRRKPSARRSPTMRGALTTVRAPVDQLRTPARRARLPAPSASADGRPRRGAAPAIPRPG